ncbi:hypothetical protein SODALDRAFT_320115 [Sodiomyces alkalinus F11]|uniref:NTF2 domain-containing protein n=1 Tax=Sodiomyces alkalinus (strain CBS 110278 / VKM F-3762 / F11) TaxID=1314773 RepID=A0A3N2QAE6_SODAK|nr:hypothetical protein SODALDRAFT_320115 [Sodiomyces alkalinus F11]ROT43720.1 hypothetical protein SODALDRAFT_320115 [Sodiomyces alkalinus F11]
MALPTRETQIKQAADTAKIFVDAYYDALNRRRPSAALPPFYVSASTAYNTHPPDISINGRPLTSPAEYAALLEQHYFKGEANGATAAAGATGATGATGGAGGAGATPNGTNPPATTSRQAPATTPQVRFEIESFDAHVVNPDYNLAAPPHVLSTPDKSGAKCSVLTQVTGRVYYGRGRDAPAKTFNEVFVLVPNWDMFVRNPPKGARRWLIMSQNFRAL